MDIRSYILAAEAILTADAIIITAGAGMGVDSGLPDYRGNFGFWDAYPAYAEQGICFEGFANPYHFNDDPSFGWGFYGHCAELYRNTTPHNGFQILKKWIELRSIPYFVVTSNVDGQFQKAGFDEDRVYEIHGSLHWLQCQTLCHREIWQNSASVSVDEKTMRAQSPLPLCEKCGQVSRPNVLMFGDWLWLSQRSEAQKKRLDAFLAENTEQRIVVVELGAGTTIPAIRNLSERYGQFNGISTVVRINPYESDISEPNIAVPYSANNGLRRIDEVMSAFSRPRAGLNSWLGFRSAVAY